MNLQQKSPASKRSVAEDFQKVKDLCEDTRETLQRALEEFGSHELLLEVGSNVDSIERITELYVAARTSPPMQRDKTRIRRPTTISKDTGEEEKTNKKVSFPQLTEAFLRGREQRHRPRGNYIAELAVRQR